MKIICVLGVIFCFTASAFAMADRTPPVYGRPTLYGEYEVSNDDTQRVAKMYGNAPSHSAAIRSGVIKNTPAAKHPVKAKKTATKKKAVKKSKTKPAKIAKELPAPKPDVVVQADVAPVAQPEMVEVPKVPKEPIASPDAESIAARAADRVDIESFCTQTKRQGKGNLPDGIIMMPGRPDLMSCVSNNKD